MRILILMIFLFNTLNFHAQAQDKLLLDLYDFEARQDSARNCQLVSYPGLNLVLHESDTISDLYVKSKLALLITRKGYTNRFQVFDSAFLLVSIVKGISPAATPYQFQRDSTFIIDLSSGKVKFVKGNHFFLVSDKKVLMGFYPRTAAQEKGPHMGFCVVESIDFEKSTMVLFSRMQKTYGIQLENVDKAFQK